MKERNEIMRFFGLHPQNDVRRSFAFTLAEVLITLGIIGVVAAMTIPTLINNYQTKSWNTAAKVFEAKFIESLKTMNVQGQLGKYGKYDSTEGFVEELQKHFKIANVCDRDHLMQCFEKTTTWGDKEADLSNIKESKDFVQLANGEEDWGTNVMGVQFANGVTGLIAYNPKCKSDPHDNRINGSNCYALLYDTSGFSEPNELGKDLRSTANVKNLAGGDCVAEAGDVCITKLAFVPEPLSDADCQSLKSSLGIKICYPDAGAGLGDYWAGAVRQCGGVSKLPTKAQLAQIANYVYGTTDIGADTEKIDLTLDTTKALSLGFQFDFAGRVFLWSGEENSDGGVFYRSITPDSTLADAYGKFARNDGEDSGHIAICVDN